MAIAEDLESMLSYPHEPELHACPTSRRAHRLLVMLKLRRLQAINDAFGFDVGDQLIVDLGARLADRLRTRFSGDADQLDLWAFRLTKGDFAVLADSDDPDLLARVSHTFIHTDGDPVGGIPVLWFAVRVTASSPDVTATDLLETARQIYPRNVVDVTC